MPHYYEQHAVVITDISENWDVHLCINSKLSANEILSPITGASGEAAARGSPGGAALQADGSAWGGHSGGLTAANALAGLHRHQPLWQYLRRTLAQYNQVDQVRQHLITSLQAIVAVGTHYVVASHSQESEHRRA